MIVGSLHAENLIQALDTNHAQISLTQSPRNSCRYPDLSPVHQDDLRFKPCLYVSDSQERPQKREYRCARTA